MLNYISQETLHNMEIKVLAANPRDWKRARMPNYKVNKDFEYPYSECPFLGEYNLVLIPKEGLIEHVDYWGEGLIEVKEGRSGFKDCYNVNHTYQLVSNGDADTRNRKIPNRIPVINYIDCNTNSYIKDNSVKIVTLMSAPINKSCASDIARMINDKEGIVVLYGIDRNTQDVNNLEQNLNWKYLVYCPAFELPKRLQGLTLYDKHLSFVNLDGCKDVLYNHVTSAQYDQAVNLCIELRKAQQGKVIADVLELLLHDANPKTMTFAYKLWVGGCQDLIATWFPSELQFILRTNNVQIVSHYYDQALKLDASIDNDKDRLAWGDSKDKSSVRVIWKFFPELYNDQVIFKIKNNEYKMFLKLDSNPDSVGDRKCYGSANSFEDRHKWLLEPVRFKDEVLFFIINYNFQQGLKLATEKDVYGDRILWGHNGNIVDNPDYYGWKIIPK